MRDNELIEADLAMLELRIAALERRFITGQNIQVDVAKATTPKYLSEVLNKLVVDAEGRN